MFQHFSTLPRSPSIQPKEAESTIFQHASRPAKLFRHAAHGLWRIEIRTRSSAGKRVDASFHRRAIRRYARKDHAKISKQHNGQARLLCIKTKAEIPALKAGKESRSQTVPRVVDLGLFVPIGRRGNSWTEMGKIPGSPRTIKFTPRIELRASITHSYGLTTDVQPIAAMSFVL